MDRVKVFTVRKGIDTGINILVIILTIAYQYFTQYTNGCVNMFRQYADELGNILTDEVNTLTVF